ncbi:MAG: V-type ATP synthase subunit I [Candidatus Micrarchaeia archaeon]
MLRTEPMKKIRAVFLEEDKKKVIDTLHNMSIIEFRKSGLSLIDDSPLPYYQDIYELLVKFEGALRLMPKQKPRQKFEQPSLQELLKQAKGMKEVDKLYELNSVQKELLEEKKELSYALYLAKGFSCLNVNLSRLKSENAKIEAYAINPKFENMLENLGREKGIAVSKCTNANETFVLIAYLKGEEKSKKVYELVNKVKAKQLDLNAKYLDLDKKAKDLAGILQNKLARIEQQLAENARQIQSIEKQYAKIAAIVEMLHIELDRANASAMFKKTDKTSIIEGWIPEKRFPEFEKGVYRATKGRAHIETLQSNELAPTLLGRKGALKSFDYAVEFFSTPRSDELDPTWVFLFSFLIFYGFMVSDVGYGILSFLLATWICKITDPDGIAYNAAKIWQIGALPAIVFGVVTNQYFGLALNQYFMPFGFKGISWDKNMIGFLLFGILLGMIQIMIGLAFGFINKYRRNEKKKAFGKLAGMLMLVFGSLFVYGAFFKALPGKATSIFGIFSAVSLVLAIALSGREGVEVMSIITHTLSYSRLMGFGITSVMIAYLINMAFLPTLSHGVLVFVILVLAFLSFHTMNMIVSIFEGIVQGIRLNVVEFFTKFYTGGGIKFRPFGYKRMLTKEKM